MDATKLLANYKFKSKLFALYFNLEESGRKTTEPFHCPHCGGNTTLTDDNVSFDFHYDEKHNCLYITAYLECMNPNCLKLTVLYEEIYLSRKFDSCTTYDIKKEILASDKPNELISSTDLHCIIPAQETPELAFPHDEDKEMIPSNVLEDFFELQRISNFSITASVMFARRLLERIILNRWPDVVTAKNWKYGFPTLNNMIDWLDEDIDGKKRYDNTDVMHSLRIIGNKAIHVFSPTKDINISTAGIKEMIAAFDSIINEIYIIPESRKRKREYIEGLARETEERSEELKKETIAESKAIGNTER